MKKTILSAIFATVVAMTSHAATFITPTAITSSTAGTDLWAASNLAQGPGVGYDAAEPHVATTGPGAVRGDNNWVTAGNANGTDYFGAVALPAPVLTIDLGVDTLIGAINTWQYWHGGANQNSVGQFSLRFATDAEGTAGFGSSITYNPTFTPDYNNTLADVSNREQFTFDSLYNVRYVEFTALDNFVGDPDVLAGGGDRVGLSEIAFEAVPEPSTGLLSILAGLGLLARRRR